MLSPMARHGAGREIEMPCEIDVQLHADQIRDIGYTVIERAAAADLVDGLKQALLRTEHEHGLGYAKTSFEGFKPSASTIC
jgi:hypothetical protein